MSRKDEFNKGMEALLNIDKSVKGFYDSDLGTSAASRKAFEDILEKNYGMAAPIINYEDRRGTLQHATIVSRLEASKVVGQLNHHLDDILAEVDETKLGDNALSTKPIEINNKKHDESVEAHKKVIKYAELIERGKSNYESVAREVQNLVGGEIRKSLENTKNNPLNGFADKKVIEDTISYLTGLAGASKDYGLTVLQKAQNRAADKFEETFPEKDRGKKMAEYAKANLKAQLAMGGDDAVDAARRLYLVTAKKK